MILAVDMGNTNIVVGGIDEKNIYFLERITTDRAKTDLEYAVSIKSILEIHKLTSKDIEGVIVSSVVPPLNTVLASAVKKIAGIDCIMVSHMMKLAGLSIKTDNPDMVGNDLIVASVAALSCYRLPLAVIDLGTATTICVIDSHKNYLGGVIHPGLRISLDTLSSKTAQLPFIELEHPGKIIASNTVDSMRSGILYGHAGMIDGCIDHMEAELGEKLTVVATGGLARFVIPICRHDIKIDDNLLLKGLLVLYRENTMQS